MSFSPYGASPKRDFGGVEVKSVEMRNEGAAS
jgi:hypothetical protein